MKVGIDSYCYHRFFGEVYPQQRRPANGMTLEDFLNRALEQWQRQMGLRKGRT